MRKGAADAERPMEQLVLGIDVGGTKCVALLGDTTGRVLQRVQWPSEAQKGPELMLGRIEQECRKLIDAAPAEVKAVGVSIGGPLDTNHGVILSPPNLPGWDRIPLRDILASSLHLPVLVEHDAAACAMAEYLWGNWGEPEVLGYLTCGTGFGLGLVVNGKVFGGAAGRRPEVGHWRVRDEGPHAFGKSGSAEAMCSGSGLCKLAAWLYPSRWPAGLDGPDLSRLAKAGDQDARAVLLMNARYTGRVCAMLADLLTPCVITLGSLSRYLGQTWLDEVRAEFRRETEPIALDLCRVEPAALGDRLGDVSALAAATAGIRQTAAK